MSIVIRNKKPKRREIVIWLNFSNSNSNNPRLKIPTFATFFFMYFQFPRHCFLVTVVYYSSDPTRLLSVILKLTAQTTQEEVMMAYDEWAKTYEEIHSCNVSYKKN